MRILIVNNYAYVTGGADLHCLEIAKGLQGRGHEVMWLATQSRENFDLAGAFVPLEVGSKNRDDLDWKSKLRVARRAIWNPAAAGAMRQLIHSFRPDVVHVHKAYVQLSVAPILVASKNGVPLVQTVHDYELLSASAFDSRGSRWDCNESKFSYRALNSVTLIPRISLHRPRIDSWIAVSDAVSRTYKALGQIDCTVIPNFSMVSGHERVPLQNRNGMLYLGRLSSEKGITHVIEAARLLPGVNFTIAGDGPLRPLVQESSDCMSNVDYVGFVSKAQGGKLLRDAEACLMPSLWQEPGPLACLEAMAEGTPVICYPSGGLQEYVSDAQAGVVCSSSEPGELAAKIETLSSDQRMWERFSESGPEEIKGRHSLARYLDSLEEVYRQAIDA